MSSARDAAREARERRRYKRLQRMLPGEFREQHGDELADAFADEIRDARAHGGRGAVLWVWMRGVVDLLSLRARRAPFDESRAPASQTRQFLGTALLESRAAFRTPRRAPVFSLTVIATLALGIAASATMFAIVHGVLLAPLPYPDAEELVAVWHEWQGRSRVPVSAGAFVRWRERTTPFAELALLQEQGFGLSLESAEQVQGARVTPSFFDTLGVEPLHGRTFSVSEGSEVGDPVTVIGYDLWRDRFGGDPEAVGSTVRLAGVPHVVVGVMPEGFRPRFRSSHDLWVPLVLDEGAHEQLATAFLALARMLPGVTVAQAARDMDGVMATLIREEPEIFTDHHVEVESLLEPAISGARANLWLLFGSVAILLLMACANVANLVLLRIAQRFRELALRRALGAGTGRLAAQLIAEHTVLALVAGVLGVLATWALTTWVLSLAPSSVPRLDNVVVDGRVVGFALGVTLLTAFVCGVLPVARTARRVGGEGHRVTGGSSGALSAALVSVQVAVSLLLLVGAGLLGKSLYELSRADTGFEVAGQLVISLEVPEARYPDAATRTAFFETLEREIAGLPGVEAVGLSTLAPMQGSLQLQYFAEGHARTDTPAEAPAARYDAVTEGYFEALGVELVSGRGPRETMANVDSYPEGRTLVYINETMAWDLYPEGNALGKTIFLPERDAEVVGVVRDVRQQSIDEARRHHMFVPHAHLIFPWFSRDLVVRTSAVDARQLVPQVRQALARLDPEQAIADIRTMNEVHEGAIAQPRFSVLLLALFGVLAVASTSLGVYGVVSFVVAQRIREAGVRKALGARDGQIERWMIGRGMRPVLVGAAVGLLTAVWLSRFAAAQLYEVAALDTQTYIAALLVVLAVGVAAVWVPARRAGNADPTVSLRA